MRAPLWGQFLVMDGVVTLHRLAYAVLLAAGLALPVQAGAPGQNSDAQPARAAAAGAEQFHRDIEPILSTYCYDCHGNGCKEGSVTLDEFANDDAVLESRDLWLRALKMLRAGMMPPADVEVAPPPSNSPRSIAGSKPRVFRIDPANPDPGRVTVRRLNRVEYRNTIRDLMGVDFDVQTQFPPDDTGNGFDNMADVLTMSPLLLGKVHRGGGVDRRRGRAHGVRPSSMSSAFAGGRFKRNGRRRRTTTTATRTTTIKTKTPSLTIEETATAALIFSYYEKASASPRRASRTRANTKSCSTSRPRRNGSTTKFDLNRCRLTLKVDGEELPEPGIRPPQKAKPITSSSSSD